MDSLGCKTVAELQKVEVSKLIEEASALALRVWAERDGKHIPSDPFEAYAAGAVKDIDILHGCNKDEMGYFIYGFGLDLYRDFAA